MTLASVDLAPVAVSLLVGVVIPHIVDLVTHSSAAPSLKSFLAVVFASLTGALSTVVWQGVDDWRIYLINIFVAFVTAFTSHTAGASEFVEKATGNFGIGKRIFPPETVR